MVGGQESPPHFEVHQRFLQSKIHAQIVASIGGLLEKTMGLDGTNPIQTRNRPLFVKQTNQKGHPTCCHQRIPIKKKKNKKNMIYIYIYVYKDRHAQLVASLPPGLQALAWRFGASGPRSASRAWDPAGEGSRRRETSGRCFPPETLNKMKSLFRLPHLGGKKGEFHVRPP